MRELTVSIFKKMQKVRVQHENKLNIAHFHGKLDLLINNVHSNMFASQKVNKYLISFFVAAMDFPQRKT